MRIVTLICSLYLALAYQDPLCEVPTFPEHGAIKMPHRGLNGTATFFCFDKYWYTGTTTRVCQTNGQWSGHPGVCKEVQCPKQPNPPNGNVQYTGKGFLATAEIKCNLGYVYSHPESNTRTCQGNNTWSWAHGVCQVIKCPNPTVPENGYLEMASRNAKAVIQFNCKEGFKYTGTTRWECQQDGRWMGTEGHCQAVHCNTSLPEVEHGKTFSTGTQYGSTVILQCDSGFTIGGPDKIICQAEGQWTDTLGECTSHSNHMLLLLLLLVPINAILLGLMFWYCFKRKHRGGQYEDAEMQDLLSSSARKRTTFHCSFVLKNTIDLGGVEPEHSNFASDMEEKVKAAFQEQGKRTVNVHVECVSPQKRMVILGITCSSGISEAQIRKVLSSPSTSLAEVHMVIATSICFREHVSTLMAKNIIKQKQVKDKDLDRAIDLETQYVNLKISSSIATQEEHVRTSPYNQPDLENDEAVDVKDEDIIKPGDVQKFVVITGRAGIGKTTLMQRLMWKWAHGEWATHLKVIFLLNLRQLLAISQEFKLNLPKTLSKHAVYKINNSHLNANWMEENQQQIGFILDGLDEIDDFEEYLHHAMTKRDISEPIEPINWGLSLLKRVCLRASTLIVTSRPFKGLSLFEPTLVIEVMGLTRVRIMEFIDKNVKPARVNMVKQTLLNQPILLSVSTITFYCAALCMVLQDDVGVSANLTTYTQITAYIMERYMCRSMNKPNTSDDLSEVFSSLRTMCAMAYGGLVKHSDTRASQMVFDKEDFEKYHMKNDDVAKVRKAGLFVTKNRAPENSHAKQILGEFVHLSIQEFLAMAGVLVHGTEKLRETLKRLSTSGQFNMALLFLYGFAFNKSNKFMTDLYSAIGKGAAVAEEIRSELRQHIFDVPDDLQVLQMVHESQVPEIAQEVGEKRFPSKASFICTKITAVDVLALTFLLRHHPSTNAVYLRDVGLDAVCIEELAKFLKGNSSVTSVQLWDNGIDDGSVECLSNALTVNKSVTTLQIGSTNITDEGVKSVATLLKEQTTLTNLMIGRYTVTDEGLELLSESLRVNATLTHLKIESDRVTDKGLNFLAEMLKVNKTLAEIVMPWMDINDKCARILLRTMSDNKTVNISVGSRMKCSLEIKDNLKREPRIK